MEGGRRVVWREVGEWWREVGECVEGGRRVVCESRRNVNMTVYCLPLGLSEPVYVATSCFQKSFRDGTNSFCFGQNWHN